MIQKIQQTMHLSRSSLCRRMIANLCFLPSISIMVNAYEWQPATPYIDPDNLCEAGATGYRATKDCSGYVFCNNGYLMGGGEAGEAVNSVIYCASGQLYDEGMGACLPKSSVRCPGTLSSFSNVSKPEPRPQSRQPTRRPTTPSASNTRKRSPRPNPTNSLTSQMMDKPAPHAPSSVRSPSWINNWSPSAPSILSSALQPPPPASPPSRRPTPNPVSPQAKLPTRRPTPKPTMFAWFSAENNNEPSVAATVNRPVAAQRPSNNNNSPAAAEALTNDVYLYGSLRSSYYCGPSWGDWSSETCVVVCPTGLHSDCPDGQNCFAGTPCASIVQEASMYSPTPPPTPNPTFGFEGDASKRFCGYNWADVIRNCLTAVPCPGGFATGVCPDGMYCIADAPCSDQEYLSYLNGQQEQQTNGIVGSSSGAAVNQSSQSITSTNVGSSVGAGSVESQPNAPPTGVNANANDGSNNGESVSMLYQNPAGNGFFCGGMFSDILPNCLHSKPCPGGFAPAVCDDGEGCFWVPTCKAQYEAAALVNNLTSIPSKQPSAPTSNPTPKSSEALTATQQTNMPPKVLAPQPTTPISTTPKPTAKLITPSTPYHIFPPKRTTSSPSTQGIPNPMSPTNNANGLPSATPQPTKPILSLLLPEEADLISNESPTELTDEDENGGEEPKTNQNLPITGELSSNQPSQITTLNPSKQVTAVISGGASQRPVTLKPSSQPAPILKPTNPYKLFPNQSPKPFASQTQILPEPAKNSPAMSAEPSKQILSSVSLPPKGASDMETSGGGEVYQNQVTSQSLTNLVSTYPSKQPSSIASGTVNQNPIDTNKGPPLCSLCDDTTLDPAHRVEIDGSEMYCGQFGWLFSSNSVLEGSVQCYNFRAQYAEKCCTSFTAVGGGKAIDKQPINNIPSPNIQKESETCSMCENSKLDESVRVQLEGYSISCGQFSLIFSTKSILEGSNQCSNLRGQYFYQCCTNSDDNISLSLGRPLQSPSLPPTGTLPMPKPSSDSSLSSGGILQSTSPPTLDIPPPPTTMLPTPQPIHPFGQWRTGELLAPASKMMVLTFWPYCFSFLLIIIT